MQFCTNWCKNIVQLCRRVVPKYSVLNEGRTRLTKISVLTDHLKVGLRVNSNGPRMKPHLEFSLSILDRKHFLVTPYIEIADS